MHTILGIDLGTTNSAAAVLQAGEAVLIPNADGDLLTPSVVSFGDDGVALVGASAHARLTTAPSRTVACFKRDMGTARTWRVGGVEYSPEQVSAMVLRTLKEDAEAFLGHPIEEAVVTVPAYFNDAQRQATRSAGEIAGLRVERILNEPTAAALAYGLHNLDNEVVAIVLDLGGGTFDVTVLEIIEGVIEIQSSSGDSRLGGEDFVDRMVTESRRLIEEQVGGEVAGDARTEARLREACELAKKRLSATEETRLVVPRLRVGDREHDLEIPLTREQVDEWFAPLMRRIERPIHAALADARLRPDAIDEVLLVGGATRMPLVRRLAARLFGRLPLHALPADEAVAMGAAVQAALKEGKEEVEELVVTDVAPFSLGIATSMFAAGRHVPGMFSPIIERGTVIPCSRVERYSTLQDGQDQIRIAVFQGEHSQTRDNTGLGSFLVRVPKGPAGQEAVDVRFTYDLNGILEVETRVVSTGRKVDFVVEQRPGTLTPDELATAREAMKALKTHPRDLLPNRTALLRAEALHVQCRGGEREQLVRGIANLESALERQDPDEIAFARERLIALVSSIGTYDG